MEPLGIEAPNSFMSLQSIQNQQQQVLQKMNTVICRSCKTQLYSKGTGRQHSTLKK